MQEELNVDEVQVSRSLHFVVHTHGQNRCRPAVVVEAWHDQGKPGYCNLVVFTDGTNDGQYGTDEHKHFFGQQDSDTPVKVYGLDTSKANLSLLTRWETSVMPNHAVRAVRSWHWPRECKGLELPAAPYTNLAKEVFHHNHGDSVKDPHNCYACRLQETEQAAAR